MAMSLYSCIFAMTLAVFTEAGSFENYWNSININSGKDCGTVIVSGLNDTQIKEIVNAHIANNRGPLTWSKELAAAAQTIANQCGIGGGPPINWRGSYRFTQLDDSYRDVSFTNIVNSMFKPRPTYRVPIFRRPASRITDSRVPPLTMSDIIYGMISDMNIRDVTLPEMKSLEMNPLELNSLEMNPLELNSLEMNSLEMNSLEMNSLEMGSPDFSISNNFLSRRYRDLTGDYTNMLGCGFLETQNGSNFIKRFVCLYGPRGNTNPQN